VKGNTSHTSQSFHPHAPDVEAGTRAALTDTVQSRAVFTVHGIEVNSHMYQGWKIWIFRRVTLQRTPDTCNERVQLLNSTQFASEKNNGFTYYPHHLTF
jgi:hypothetical protein